MTAFPENGAQDGRGHGGRRAGPSSPNRIGAEQGLPKVQEEGVRAGRPHAPASSRADRRVVSGSLSSSARSAPSRAASRAVKYA